MKNVRREGYIVEYQSTVPPPICHHIMSSGTNPSEKGSALPSSIPDFATTLNELDSMMVRRFACFPKARSEAILAMYRVATSLLKEDLPMDSYNRLKFEQEFSKDGPHTAIINRCSVLATGLHYRCTASGLEGFKVVRGDGSGWSNKQPDFELRYDSGPNSGPNFDVFWAETSDAKRLSMRFVTPSLKSAADSASETGKGSQKPTRAVFPLNFTLSEPLDESHPMEAGEAKGIECTIIVTISTSCVSRTRLDGDSSGILTRWPSW